jgi:hypothetical protein
MSFLMEQQEPRPSQGQIPAGHESKGRSATNPWSAAAEWLGKTGVAAITAVGLLLYVFLRLPYSLFYGRLGTSPEELRLGYVEILAQSTVGIFLISAAGLVIVLATGYIITYASSQGLPRELSAHLILRPDGLLIHPNAI